MLSDEQMSNWLGVEHQPVYPTNPTSVFARSDTVEVGTFTGAQNKEPFTEAMGLFSVGALDGVAYDNMSETTPPKNACVFFSKFGFSPFFEVIFFV